MTQVVVAQWFSLKLNRNYLLRAWRKRTVKSNTKLSKILGEKNEAPCDDATWNFECGRSRSITKGFLPTIKLVNLSTGGRAEFAPKLCIAYWPQTYCISCSRFQLNVTAGSQKRAITNLRKSKGRDESRFALKLKRNLDFNCKSRSISIFCHYWDKHCHYWDRRFVWAFSRCVENDSE